MKLLGRVGLIIVFMVAVPWPIVVMQAQGSTITFDSSPPTGWDTSCPGGFEPIINGLTGTNEWIFDNDYRWELGGQAGARARVIYRVVYTDATGGSTDIGDLFWNNDTGYAPPYNNYIYNLDVNEVVYWGFYFSGGGTTTFYLHGGTGPAGSDVADIFVRVCGSLDGTPTPTPTLGALDECESGIPNALCNGNFESSLDGNWELGPEITLDTLPPTIIQNGSQRVNSAANPYNSGNAYCSTNFMLIRGTGISQRFYWPGGTMYIQYRLRRKVADGGRSYPQVNLTFVTGGVASLTVPLFDGDDGDFVDRDPGENIWQLNQHTLNMNEGWFDFTIFNVDYESMYYTPPGEFYTGTPPPTATAIQNPDLIYEARADYDFEIDDVTVSQDSWLTHCSGGGETITPVPSITATRTPTRTPGPTSTRTPTRTPGPSPTPTNAGTAVPPSNFGNCNFESGSAGWLGTNFSIRLAGGPIGPQYAEVRQGGVIYQPFTWSTTANAYFTFWIGPNSYGEVSVRNTSTNTLTQLWVGSNGSSWVMRSAVRSALPNGNYRIEARPYGSTPFLIDGVMVARNTYAFCGSNNGNPVTPTSGPTAFITPTITRTPTNGPTFTPRPPTVTPTPGPTRTPINTWTPGPSPTPSNTIVPSETPGNDATATAQASISPSPTPPPTTTTLPMPPQQPEPQPYAECIRPDNPFNVAWWGEYGTCYALTWFAWSPQNTQQLLDYRTALDDREPFGTIGEVADTLTLLRDFSDGINWDSTGLACARQPVVADWIVAEASGLLNGDFAIEEGPDIASTCPLNGADQIMGTNISAGVCYSTNLLCYYGLMQWLQLFVNGGFLLIGLAYIRYAWIAKATQS